MTRLTTSSRFAEYKRARPQGRARAGLAPPPTAGPLVDSRQKKEGLRLRAGNAAGAGSPFQGGHSHCRPGRLLRCLPASSSILLPDSLGPTARRSSIAKRDHSFPPTPYSKPNHTTEPSHTTTTRRPATRITTDTTTIDTIPLFCGPLSPAQRNAHPVGAGQVGKRREDRVRWWSGQGPILGGSILASSHSIPAPIVQRAKCIALATAPVCSGAVSGVLRPPQQRLGHALDTFADPWIGQCDPVWRQTL